MEQVIGCLKMKYREKIIIINIIIVLAVLIFSLFFITIFVRQNYLRIFIGPPGSGMSVVIPEPGIRFLQRVRTILLISSGISLLIAIVFAFFTASRITKPLKEMNGFAKRIADGDYSAKVDIRSKDEIGELAESLNYMAYRLQDIENMRKTLIQNVSHDLRTPLTSVKGYLELIEEPDTSKEEIAESLKVIKSQVSKMERMVQELTDLSIIDGKQYELNMDKLELVSLTKKVCASLKVIAIQKNIDFKESYPEEEVYIKGDGKRTEELLSNLINNSIKFTNKGYVSVSLYKDKNNAIYEIEDTGIGIDEKDLPHVFERFYRGDKARTNDNSGIGIGLAIVKELVFVQNGQISVQSKVNEGTKFTVKFPLYS